MKSELAKSKLIAKIFLEEGLESAKAEPGKRQVSSENYNRLV